MINRLAALALAVACSATQAEFWDGNVLHQRITSTSQVERAIALGYVMGVHDALAGVTHCTPANVTSGQVNDMVRNYLDNTPAVRHFSADALVNRVLKSVWPCPERRRDGSNT